MLTSVQKVICSLLDSDPLKNKQLEIHSIPGEAPLRLSGTAVTTPLPIKAENWWQNTLEIPAFPTTFHPTPRVYGRAGHLLLTTRR
jgi:hypothetical protein